MTEAISKLVVTVTEQGQTGIRTTTGYGGTLLCTDITTVTEAISKHVVTLTEQGQTDW